MKEFERQPSPDKLGADLVLEAHHAYITAADYCLRQYVTIDGKTLTGPKYALQLANEALDLLGQAEAAGQDVTSFSQHVMKLIE